MKRVVFFNYYHNGDIHVSRGFVRQIMAKVHQSDPTIKFEYAHNNAPSLLADIPNLSFDLFGLRVINDDHISTFATKDTVYINTWYGQQHHKYLNRHGLCFDVLYDIFNENCKSVWKFSLEEISTDASIFFPTIDYEKYQIKQAQDWLTAHPAKKVFISNGLVLSDQAHEFSFTPIVSDLAAEFNDMIFILSNRFDRKYPNIQRSNVFYSGDIIKKRGHDLNENAFITSKCDVIIGKASGAFTFAVNRHNLFERDVKLMAFCNLIPPDGGQFWVGNSLKDKFRYKADVFVSNESNGAVAYKLIKKHLTGVSKL